MFVTFKTSESARGRNERSETMPMTNPNGSVKRKRSTVLRACEWCRHNRVKCDNGRPCENCRLRKQLCSREPSGDPKEIEHLRTRIAELEASSARLEPFRPAASEQLSLSWSWPDAWIFDQGNLGDAPRYFGPTSFIYFSSRVCQSLERMFQRAYLGADLRSFTINETTGILSEDDGQDHDPLSRQQEGFLLSLFWQSYQFIFPVIDKTDFCNHYDSLWVENDYHDPESLEPQNTRMSSPLADIALALCMQHTASMMADENPSPEDHSSRSGDWLFHRCQRLLAVSDSRPSLHNLQSTIYSIVYLMNSSCFERARRSLANAVQAAYSLGLHHNLAGDIPADLQKSKDTQSQVWQAIYCLDSLLSFKLGQPCLINPSEATICAPPPPGPEPTATTINDSEECSRLWYFPQYFKLTSKMREVSFDILLNCASLMSQKGATTSIHQEPSIRQQCSAYLKESMKPLHEWTKEVPPFLRIKRQGDGDPFSTNAPLDLDPYAPIWVQRQRALLELSYHNAMQSIFRLFMKIPLDTPFTVPGIGASFPNNADRNDIHALDHAVASIRITDQILSGSNVLNSWHDAYHYTWDAALTIFAYTLVHPLCPYTFAARRAIDTAKGIFDIFFEHGFPTAAQASRITVAVKEVVYSHSRSFKTGPRRELVAAASRQDTPGLNMNMYKSGVEEGLFGPMHDFEIGRPASGVDVFRESPLLQIDDFGLDPMMGPLDELGFTGADYIGRYV